MPKRFAGRHDSCRQIVQCGDNVGSILNRVLTTDRLDLAFASLFDRHADAVTTNQPSALVGDDVCRLLQVQRLVRRASKRIGLLPKRLTIAQRPQLLDFATTPPPTRTSAARNAGSLAGYRAQCPVAGRLRSTRHAAVMLECSRDTAGIGSDCPRHRHRSFPSREEPTSIARCWPHAGSDACDGSHPRCRC